MSDILAELKDIEEQAKLDTGLSDFGEGDWREAMLRLTEAAHKEAKLSQIGKISLSFLNHGRLKNRLAIQDWVTRHPEVHEQTIEKSPIILATLPRTGQTASGWIFDCDSSNYALRSWYVKRPCPPPKATGNEDDPRLEQERIASSMIPDELKAMHLYDAEEPDECHYLLSNDFKVPHEIYTMPVHSYYRWVRDEANMKTAYEYYLLQLKILQSNWKGGRWVLKNSPHLLFLDELHEVLPDPHYVQFHRDPLKVLASNCKLSGLLRDMFCEDVDLHEVGESMLQVLCDYLERLLAFRDSGKSRPWIDINFRDFVSDPSAAIESIYTKADIPLSNEGREGMASWVKEHPRDDLGACNSRYIGTLWH